MLEFLQSNLVVLQYSPNNCYTQLVEETPEPIEVDPVGGTWSYREKRLNNYNRQSFKIGTEHRSCQRGARYGVIGVYDRTDIRHLNAMLHASHEATADYSDAD